MKSAVLRLAGPLQSYGEQSRYGRRTTQPTPTLSGLIGLFSAALGYTRGDAGQPAGIGQRQWLLDLDIAVRVDRPGQLLEDYQVVSGRPVHRYRRHLASNTIVPRPQVTMGSGTAWKVGGRVESSISQREYLADAEFLVFVSGTGIGALADALRSPRFQLSLGRKSCVPEYPILLGVVSTDADPTALVPSRTVTPPRDSPPPLRVLRWSPTGAEPPVLDVPAGPSPVDGYLPMRRDITVVDPPRLHGPQSRLEQLAWVQERTA